MTAAKTPEEPRAWTLGVLAGGASSRMGRDKALLELDGETLLERCVSGCSSLAADVLIAAGADERSLPGRLAEVRVVVDARENAGPLAGIEALVAGTATSWLVVVPCDMPHLRAEHLQALVDAGEDADLVHYDGGEPRRSLPLALRIDWAAGAVRAALDRGRRRVDAIFDRGRVCAICLADRENAGKVFYNVNTPGDFVALQRPPGTRRAAPDDPNPR